MRKHGGLLLTILQGSLVFSLPHSHNATPHEELEGVALEILEAAAALVLVPQGASSSVVVPHLAWTPSAVADAAVTSTPALVVSSSTPVAPAPAAITSDVVAPLSPAAGSSSAPPVAPLAPSVEADSAPSSSAAGVVPTSSAEAVVPPPSVEPAVYTPEPEVYTPTPEAVAPSSSVEAVAPTSTPAPAAFTPAPVIDTPAPVADTPTPEAVPPPSSTEAVAPTYTVEPPVYTPEPAVYTPTPEAVIPTTSTEAIVPTSTPEPAVYTPAPEPVVPAPTSDAVVPSSTVEPAINTPTSTAVIPPPEAPVPVPNVPSSSPSTPATSDVTAAAIAPPLAFSSSSSVVVVAPTSSPAPVAPQAPSKSSSSSAKSSSSSVVPSSSSSSSSISSSSSESSAISSTSSVAVASSSKSSVASSSTLSSVSSSSSATSTVPSSASSSSKSSSSSSSSRTSTSASSTTSTKSQSHHSSSSSSSSTKKSSSSAKVKSSTESKEHSSHVRSSSTKSSTRSKATSSALGLAPHDSSTSHTSSKPRSSHVESSHESHAHVTSTAAHASESHHASPHFSLVTEVFTRTIVIDVTKTVTSCWTTVYATSKSPAPEYSLTSSAPQAPPQYSPIAPSVSTPGPVTNTPKATVVVPQEPEKTTTVVVTLQTTLTTSETQTVTLTVSPVTAGTYQTSLQTAGNPSTQPFNATVIPTPSAQISPIHSGTALINASPTIAAPSMALAGNIFVPVASGAPPPQVSSRGDHPVPRLGIKQTGPVGTNKFYSNFYLSSRTASAFTFPYSISWVSGQGATKSWGLAIEHVTRAKTVYGPGSPPSYYINPLGLQSIIISARELGDSTSLTMSKLTAFSANVNLAPTAGASSMLTFPLVQGMAFTTAIFNSGTPLIQSNSAFTSLVYGGKVSGGAVRYVVTLNDNTTWFIYLTPASGSAIPTLTLASPQMILGERKFSGTVQVAKNPDTLAVSASEPLYDAASGVYPINATLRGAVNGTKGSYTLAWTKRGLTSKKLLMFALPHHVSSLSSTSKSTLKTGFFLQTPTKGLAYGIHADSMTLDETLPTSLGFAPWSPKLGSQTKLPASAIQLINNVAATELAEDMQAQTDLDSMYYAGKGLAKFASIIYAANNLGHSTGVASAGLAKLKVQFSRFVNNTQQYPLVYDSAWGGMVSSASYVTGDSGLDFGNSYYNDHHFHYGYFVYAAAVIGYLDPSWLKQGTNKAWVNSLVRDYANPVTNDGYFPQSRMFDWYHGHSWAAGLFESFDGKNQESSSEDAFASYALKMWGRTIGDANMEARGNLMLAIQARSFNDYYYMQTNNTIQPPSFIPNKAAGIIFENKVDHTTYFGTNIEYIEGIHMLPVNPSSTLTRAARFVSQEWSTYFSNGRVDSVAGGWRGVLYANLALIDPVTSYNFFAQSGFDNSWLDGGASRTWNLALAAGLGGAK